MKINTTQTMKKNRSPKQIEASRRNAQKSTGPKTPEGKAASKMNALKHGILSTKEVLVRGRNILEKESEFEDFHQQFWEDWNPVGAMEIELVNQIVKTVWRLRRVRKAESAEIALSVDGGQWDRQCHGSDNNIKLWMLESDPVPVMMQSVFGNSILIDELKKARDSVEKEGELTEAAIKSVVISAGANSVTTDLEKLRLQLLENPDGLDEPALRAKRKQQSLAHIDGKLATILLVRLGCKLREEIDEESRQSAALLPSPEVLDKLMRYETMLKKDLHRDMIQLERLQRRRKGEAVPPPLTMQVSGRN